LGFETTEVLRNWLGERGLWQPNAPKPARPKDAPLAALRKSQIQVSSSRFAALSRKVSLRNCEDRALGRLVATLREWFPPSS